MIFYAIKHKPTGCYLPLRPTRRGYTHSRPEPNCVPRLFKVREGAVRALGWWLKGKMTTEFFNIDEGTYKEVIIPQPDRKAEDMEVVEVHLTEAEDASMRAAKYSCRQQDMQSFLEHDSKEKV